MLIKNIFKVLFIILSPVTSGTNYYVSPSGNNANPGTLYRPFKTIAYAESKLAEGIGGNTIYVRAGTYNERVMFHLSSGEPGNPNIVMAFNNEKVIIDGTGIDISAGSALVFSWSDYVHFIGIEVRNANMTGSFAGGTGIWVNGIGCLVSNCIVHDCWAGGIRCTGNNGTIEDCHVFNVAMSNSDMIRTGDESWSAGINIRVCEYVRVSRNLLHDVYGEGLSCTDAGNVTIEDNIIYDIYAPHIYVMNSINVLVQKNLVYHTRSMGDGSQVGIGYWNEALDPKWPYRNRNNTFINNIVYGCARNLCSMCELIDVIFANNIFCNSDISLSGSLKYNVQINLYPSLDVNSIFKNNIVIQEADGFIPIFVKDGSENVGLEFSNNLFNQDYTVYAQGSGDIMGDPNFLKIGEIEPGKLSSDYFKLLSSSPAINKGAIISEVNDDIFGNSRDTKPDIGAHEFYEIDPSIKITGITISGEGGATNISSEKGTLQLIATVLPSNASDKTVKWSITNGTGQAIINSSGLVTAIADGTVTASATANDGSGVYGELIITITNQTIEVTKITLSGDKGATSITTGLNLQLNAEIFPSDATNKTVTWSITNGTGQAIINSTGLVTAISSGTVTAKATANDGSGTFGTLLLTIASQIIYVTSIAVSGHGGASTITIDKGTLQLDALILPSNATDKSVSWSIAEETGQATISPSGLVTAVSNGTVTAKAIANDGSGVSGTLEILIDVDYSNEPPVIEITSPVNNDFYEAPANIEISVNAHDPDGEISRIEYYLGSTKISEKTNDSESILYLLSDTGTYEITAKATDNLNAVAFSDPVTIYVNKNSDPTELINLFPNPNNGSFTIDLLNTLPGERNSVSVINPSGQVLYRSFISNEEYQKHFDLNDLKSGQYILIITGNKIVYTKKFVKY